LHPNPGPKIIRGKTNYKYSREIIEEVAVIPLEPFLLIFCTPDLLAQKLEALGAELARDWNSTNTSEMQGKMVAKERRMTIMRHTWTNKAGSEEASEYELTLSTYKFTKENNRRPEHLEIQIGDIRVR
jgi:hypothetical protein